MSSNAGTGERSQKEFFFFFFARTFTWIDAGEMASFRLLGAVLKLRCVAEKGGLFFRVPGAVKFLGGGGQLVMVVTMPILADDGLNMEV